MNKNYTRISKSDLNIWRRSFQIFAIVVSTIFFTIFYRIEYRGKRNIDRSCRLVVAPNHISYFDPLLVSAATGLKISYMAKKELFECNSRFANILDWLGAFAVNRERIEVSTVRSAIEVFKANWSLGIFPQGGIRKNRVIENINKGFIVFAKKAKVDILPVGLTGCEKYNWVPFKGRLIVNIGRPISYELGEEEIIREWIDQIYELTGYRRDIEKVEEECLDKKCLTVR